MSDDIVPLPNASSEESTPQPHLEPPEAAAYPPEALPRHASPDAAACCAPAVVVEVASVENNPRDPDAEAKPEAAAVDKEAATHEEQAGGAQPQPQTVEVKTEAVEPAAEISGGGQQQQLAAVKSESAEPAEAGDGKPASPGKLAAQAQPEPKEAKEAREREASAPRKKRSRSKSPQRRPGSGGAGSSSGGEHRHTVKLYVRAVERRLQAFSAIELRKAFDKYGDIVATRAGNKDYGFIDIRLSDRELDVVLREMNGANLCGGPVRVEISKESSHGGVSSAASPAPARPYGPPPGARAPQRPRSRSPPRAGARMSAGPKRRSRSRSHSRGRNHSPARSHRSRGGSRSRSRSRSPDRRLGRHGERSALRCQQCGRERGHYALDPCTCDSQLAAPPPPRYYGAQAQPMPMVGAGQYYVPYQYAQPQQVYATGAAAQPQTQYIAPAPRTSILAGYLPPYIPHSSMPDQPQPQQAYAPQGLAPSQTLAPQGMNASPAPAYQPAAQVQQLPQYIPSGPARQLGETAASWQYGAPSAYSGAADRLSSYVSPQQQQQQQQQPQMQQVQHGYGGAYDPRLQARAAPLGQHQQAQQVQAPAVDQRMQYSGGIMSQLPAMLRQQQQQQAPQAGAPGPPAVYTKAKSSRHRVQRERMTQQQGRKSQRVVEIIEEPLLEQEHKSKRNASVSQSPQIQAKTRLSSNPYLAALEVRLDAARRRVQMFPRAGQRGAPTAEERAVANAVEEELARALSDLQGVSREMNVREQEETQQRAVDQKVFEALMQLVIVETATKRRAAAASPVALSEEQEEQLEGLQWFMDAAFSRDVLSGSNTRQHALALEMLVALARGDSAVAYHKTTFKKLRSYLTALWAANPLDAPEGFDAAAFDEAADNAPEEPAEDASATPSSSRKPRISKTKLKKRAAAAAAAEAEIRAAAEAEAAAARAAEEAAAAVVRAAEEAAAAEAAAKAEEERKKAEAEAAARAEEERVKAEAEAAAKAAAEAAAAAERAAAEAAAAATAAAAAAAAAASAPAPAAVAPTAPAAPVAPAASPAAETPKAAPKRILNIQRPSQAQSPPAATTPVQQQQQQPAAPAAAPAPAPVAAAAPVQQPQAAAAAAVEAPAVDDDGFQQVQRRKGKQGGRPGSSSHAFAAKQRRQ
eukprot:m51a1_g3159 hypothetical protein (1148) ;mRNA; f:357679-362762